MSHNICSMCSGSGLTPNYAKRVDPPIQRYGTILGDSPQQGDCKRRSRGGNQGGCAGMCAPAQIIPTPSRYPQGGAAKGTMIQVPCERPAACPKFICEPCPPPPPTKIWLIKSSPMPQKSFCLPVGGFPPECPSSSSTAENCKAVVFCFPPQPCMPEPKKRNEEELKPIGLVTKNKEADFVGGKMIAGCACGRKNGLTGSCPRISCQNNPGCFMNPPRCWPQFKEPEPPPPPPPDQRMICIPIQMVYCDDPNSQKK